MKHKLFAVLGVAALLGTVSTFSAASARAAEVVGKESHEVSWHGMPASDQSDKYQVFYGQANNPNKLEYSVFDGLISTSRSVKLNDLKSCTEYSWSLKGRKGGKWSWIISDQRFTTGGVCEGAKTATPTGVSLVNDVGVKTWATGNTTGSSTISWSPTPQASEYHVYYRPSWEGKYVHSVRVPSNGTSITINSLQKGAQYLYRVAAVVDGKEKWYAEKTLQSATGEKPVLGVTTTKPQAGIGGARYDKYVKNQVMGTTDGTLQKDAMMQKNMPKVCSNMGKAQISLRRPAGVSTQKAHVMYGTEPGKYVHALRNLSENAREVQIANLDTCKTYYYQVVVVGQDGKSHLQGEQMMQAR